MSTFVALNLEPDDRPEEDVDDTKEIQVEDALRLYQTALKLHSQGPTFYAETVKAYDELFESDIFKYPEAIPSREYYRDLPENGEPIVTDDIENRRDTIGGGTEAATNALLQVVYLSYKNYGQLLLDNVKNALLGLGGEGGIEATTSLAINYFADALERDDSDLELWRKCGRVGNALQSDRITRFCLESVVDQDEYGLGEKSRSLGIEQAVAVRDLRRILESMNDKVSLSQLPRNQLKPAIALLVREREDPFPQLPKTSKSPNIQTYTEDGGESDTAAYQRIELRSMTWVSLAEEIVQLLDVDDTADHSSRWQGSVRISSLKGENGTGNNLLQYPLIQNPKPSEGQVIVLKEVSPKSENYAGYLEPVHISRDVVNVGSTTVKSSDPTDGAGSGKPMVESAATQDNVGNGGIIAVEQNGNGKENNNDQSKESEMKSTPSQSRKRSAASLTNDEPEDGGRTKSKRIRARESIVESNGLQEEVSADKARYFEDHLESCAHADEWLFSSAGNLLSKLGVEELGSLHELKKVVSQSNLSPFPPDESILSPESIMFQDLVNVMESWNDEFGRVALDEDVFSDTKDDFKNERSNLRTFLEFSKKKSNAERTPEFTDNDRLSQFIDIINSGCFSIHEVAFRFLQQLLQPREDNSGTSDLSTVTNSIYAASRFPKGMKELINKIIVLSDESILEKMEARLQKLDEKILSHYRQPSYELSPDDLSVVEISQCLYELHLDVYNSMIVRVDEAVESLKFLQEDRLDRWKFISQSFIKYYVDLCGPSDEQTALILRHLWSFTLHLNMSGVADLEYVIECLTDIKRTLILLGDPVISIVNSELMNEISPNSTDQEISRLKATSFFASVFGSEMNDPVRLVESIEPILEPSGVQFIDDHQETETRNRDTENLITFLDKGNPMLKLFLWRQLQDAYKSIEYPTKVVSCSLRSIELIMRECYCSPLSGPKGDRQINMLKSLKLLDELLTDLIGKVVNEPESSFECFDSPHVESSMSALALLSRFLQTFVLYDDKVRVGQIVPPDIRPSSTAKSLEKFKETIRSMFVKTWTIQYTLLREGIAQSDSPFDTPMDDRIHFLRSVHSVFGLRRYCKYSKKMFLKLIRQELLTLETEESYEADTAQVLFDLYGLKFPSHLDVSFEHHCPTERLDQSTALTLISFIMCQVNRMDIKDFLKSDLKATVDTVQRTLGWIGNSSASLSFNKRILSKFLKGPINPMQLFQSTQGVSEVSMVAVRGEGTEIANSGWYFMLGMAALMKFRTQRKMGPSETEDLNTAASFFRYDLQYAENKWETWFRLAQVYDQRLEESIAWSADRLNNGRSELAILERRAIHAYSMAIATVTRNPEIAEGNKKLVSDLYSQFGFRIYSSTREPLSMGAFDLGPFMRYFSSGENQQMYEEKPFRELRPVLAWGFASYLFRKAMYGRPMNWKNHYMLSKCLWKIFSSGDPLKQRREDIQVDDILSPLVDAIDALPEKKDSRSDPILEPHFKLASIVHKLVKRGFLTPENGSERLLGTPWARNMAPATNMETWKPFILKVLKNLRNADKSNWHHRIVLRAAHIIYDDTEDKNAALDAKNDLTQHIFTKTMTVQVWRPENERAGRHFVYTTRYVYFFVNLLKQLGDRSSLEMLLRRVRRKLNDYLNYTKLWEDICTTYIGLIRRAGNIGEGNEETVFKPVSHDDFSTYADRLEAWCLSGAKDTPIVELLREAVDLKKLNGTQIKLGSTDDLVADIYATLYKRALPELMEQKAEEESRGQMKVDRLLTTAEGTNVADSPSTTAPPNTQGPKTRTKGVTKREIQRRADTIAAKFGASKFSAKRPKFTEEEAQPSQPTGATSEQRTQANEDLAKESGEGEVKEPQGTESFNAVRRCGMERSDMLEGDAEGDSSPIKESLPVFPSLSKIRASSPNADSEFSTNVSVQGDDNKSGLAVSVQESAVEAAESR